MIGAVGNALFPRVAFAAQAARRFATRAQEQNAIWGTTALFVFSFLVAYRRGKREDRDEEARIKAEVARLARLKKEFDEKAGDIERHVDAEDASDDSIAASFREAQENLNDGSDEADGDGSGEGDEQEDDRGDDRTPKDGGSGGVID